MVINIWHSSLLPLVNVQRQFLNINRDEAWVYLLVLVYVSTRSTKWLWDDVGQQFDLVLRPFAFFLIRNSFIWNGINTIFLHIVVLFLNKLVPNLTSLILPHIVERISFIFFNNINCSIAQSNCYFYYKNRFRKRRIYINNRVLIEKFKILYDY